MIHTRIKTCIDIDTLADFVRCVAQEKTKSLGNGWKDDFIFRGHQREDWQLIPKLARVKWKGNFNKSETLILEEFDRAAARFPGLSTGDEWDRRAIAQHHGLPTRLLDWTKSATAALWFAVKDGPVKHEKCATEGNEYHDGAVWIFQPKAADYINMDHTPDSGTRCRIFRPRVIADRIQAQLGVFTIHKATNRPDGSQTFDPLEEHPDAVQRLIKVLIPWGRFRTIRDELYACGVHEATMYPDLDGICKLLTWRYTHGMLQNQSDVP